MKCVTSAVIFDLDNCIADDEWRIAHIVWNEPDPDRRYDRYHALAPFDELGNRATVDDARHRGLRVAVLTARPLTHRAVTLEWLRRRAGIVPHSLLMRNVGDHRPSVDIKREQLLSLPEYGIELGDIRAAFDDRADIVEMYKIHGIPAVRLFVHSVCAYRQKEATA